jgi:hypothetical protein
VVLVTYIRAVPICVTVGLTVGCVLTAFNMYRLLVNYINHFQQIRRGDFSEVHVKDRVPTNLMTGNLKYQAYQTAYFIIGFLIQVRCILRVKRILELTCIAKIRSFQTQFEIYSISYQFMWHRRVIMFNERSKNCLIFRI